MSVMVRVETRYEFYINEDFPMQNVPINSEFLTKAFEFIKAVFDTVFDMINASHRDKPLFCRSSSPIIRQ